MKVNYLKIIDWNLESKFYFNIKNNKLFTVFYI